MEIALSETFAALSHWSDRSTCVSVKIWRGFKESPAPFKARISSISSDRLILLRMTGGSEVVVELAEARMQGPKLSRENEEYIIIYPSKSHGAGSVVLTAIDA